MRPEDVERIHEASLRLLDEVGVRLEHDGIVARLLAARDGTTTVLEPESETVFRTTPVLYLWTGSERRSTSSRGAPATASR